MVKYTTSFCSLPLPHNSDLLVSLNCIVFVVCNTCLCLQSLNCVACKLLLFAKLVLNNKDMLCKACLCMLFAKLFFLLQTQALKRFGGSRALRYLGNPFENYISVHQKCVPALLLKSITTTWRSTLNIVSPESKQLHGFLTKNCVWHGSFNNP